MLQYSFMNAGFIIQQKATELKQKELGSAKVFRRAPRTTAVPPVIFETLRYTPHGHWRTASLQN